MKKRTTVYASQEYVLMAKAKGMNLSEIFENALRVELGELNLETRYKELLRELAALERALSARTTSPEYNEQQALLEDFKSVANVPKTRGMQLDWIRRRLIDYPHLRANKQTPDELLDQLVEQVVDELVPKEDSK